MKVKKIITFRHLRNDGLASLDMQEKEVIMIPTKTGSNIILHQEDLFHLLRMEEVFKEKILGQKIQNTPHDPEKMMNDFKANSTNVKKIMKENDKPSKIQLEIKKIKEEFEQKISELEKMAGND